MKNIIVLAVILCLGIDSYGANNSGVSIGLEKQGKILSLKKYFSKEKVVREPFIRVGDPCLDGAISAMNHAYAVEQGMVNWCFQTQTTSTGIVDCTSGVYQHTNQVVAAIIANFVPCPSGNGSGIASREKMKNNNS